MSGRGQEGQHEHTEQCRCLCCVHDITLLLSCKRYGQAVLNSKMAVKHSALHAVYLQFEGT